MDFTTAATGGVAVFLTGGILGFLLDKVSSWLSTSYRERKDLRVACLLVQDELRANIVRLEIALEGAPEEVADLQSQTYQAYQGILARGLDRETRDAVRAAYVFARVPRVLNRRDFLGPTVVTITGATPSPPATPPVSMVTPIAEHVAGALERARDAHERLTKYAGKAASI